MEHSYTPTYYSTLHDSITSLCKRILPFSLKKPRLPAVEHRISKLQSDNLKWQLDAFHQIRSLMGLHREGILAESEVSDFKSHLLQTIIASPAEMGHPVILKDKLEFLQELLYAKCITEDEYQASKSSLLHQLAVQGAEINARDVIVASWKENPKENPEEEWSVIDLKDDNPNETSNPKNRPKQTFALKQIRVSVLGFVSSHKHGKNRQRRSIFEIEAEKSSSAYESAYYESQRDGFYDNPFLEKGKDSETRSILMQETESNRNCRSVESKRKPFRNLFNRDEHGSEEKGSKSGKRQWGFDGIRKWKRDDSEDEISPLRFSEKSDSNSFLDSSYKLVDRPVGGGPDTKQIKKKLFKDGTPSNFFIDKVLGDNIKKELLRIQSELSTTNPNLNFSNDQIEEISTKLPVDMADLNNFFPKSWCDRYGDVILDVVKKEFKDHVREMETLRAAAKERRCGGSGYPTQWTKFEDNENSNPNLSGRGNNSNLNPFGRVNYSSSSRQGKVSSWSRDESFKNPFWDHTM